MFVTSNVLILYINTHYKIDHFKNTQTVDTLET